MSQKEIYNLYERVKLDCDLFGYTPDEYLELAYDAEMSAAP